MPLPTNEEKQLLGPLTIPFGRKKGSNKRKMEKGEDITYDISDGAYDATEDKYPPNVILIEVNDFELLLTDCSKYRDVFFEQKYLWVIGTFGLRMIRENTRNSARDKNKPPYVCHSNLTGGLEAYQGGGTLVL